MDYKNSTISLSISLQGCLAVRGRYESLVKTDNSGKAILTIEKNDDGKMEKNDALRLRTLQLPSYHNCEQHTTLGGAFCAFAVSDDARPKKTISVPYWNKLSPKNRLKLAVQQYVWDLYGRDAKFEFQILGD